MGNIHHTADVEKAWIGARTRIWRWSCVRSTAHVGEDCNIGQCVYIDRGVVVGDRCKIQNGANLYEGVALEDDVFIGPSVTFTNVKHPRAAEPVTERTRTVVKRGATIGANATIVCGVVIGEGAIVGAGSVVTKDVPSGKCVAGNPARIIGDAQPHGSAV